MTALRHNTGASGNRRQFLSHCSAVSSAVAVSTLTAGYVTSCASEDKNNIKNIKFKPVKAFCIDFNWATGAVAPPGMYAQANPAEHIRWYLDLGANTVQTFCVSYNGYAWYQSEVAPVTPDLKYPNFLGDMVNLGHKEGMNVTGYFNLGANPYWEKKNPALVHGDDAGYIKIPMTLEYIDYFCRSVEDTIVKTGVDGFMIDWVRPTDHKIWLDCEKEMYRQLLGEKFPESGAPSDETVLEFDKWAIERAWRHITQVVKATGPVIIWTNHPILKTEYSLWEGHRLLKEVDWILNEAPDLDHLMWLKEQVGPDTLIIQNLCGWKDHDASVWKNIDPDEYGFYGFAKADPVTTMPSSEIPENIKNIEILRDAYHTL
ncbi:MAG: hypothetical protein JXB48_03220 [Candidatus Latescibacteria bacterium]|nr:hypothetical protein [Candidatus Latescibacterota bacterium]